MQIVSVSNPFRLVETGLARVDIASDSLVLLHHRHLERGNIEFTITSDGMYGSGRDDKGLTHAEFHFAILQHSKSFAFYAVKISS